MRFARAIQRECGGLPSLGEDGLFGLPVDALSYALSPGDKLGCGPHRVPSEAFAVVAAKGRWTDGGRYNIAGRHDERPRARGDLFDELELLVTLSSRKLCLAIPRRMRGALALFVLTMYLVGGVLHGLCDLDINNASGKTVISLIDKGVGHSEKGVVADHHCHGCFSVSVPAPAVGAAEVIPTVKIVTFFDTDRRGVPPGLDPPPPKFLT